MQLLPIISSTQATAITADKTPNQSSKAVGAEPFWGKDGFNFADVIDMVNPMQHMPVIAKYYREQTQDDASEGSRLVGGALFGALMGGVAGILTSMANSAIRHETQYDLGEQLLMVAEESLDDIWGDQDEAQKNSFVMQNISTPTASPRLDFQQEESNPFFAQMFDEYSNDEWPSYRDSIAQTASSQQQIANKSQVHDWGEV
ncbi:hypothetical protein [sulfur-oxidizing endosymbiont of Gigantopelta aegis]|uniref:hypothetical protein n=1 Tax=sulfur-oxidizing endosymbiont of Gigantopelta aegis TaxID=2794934 RepID=UPI001BE457C2|nr:hypothetical protein [sulfur-oxidizing endosymbiont of Gigantopelta aegis]